MPCLSVKNFGQISRAEVKFGDLTLLVGPQASGKSIFLQLLKLVIDQRYIKNTLGENGFDWRNDPKQFLDLYFGENMGEIWNSETILSWNGKPVRIEEFSKTTRLNRKSQVFYIPSSRTATLDYGWPKPFMAFNAGDPFVVREFSEQLRRLMETGLVDEGGIVFPRKGRLKREYRTSLDDAIFHGASASIEYVSGKRRIVLRVNDQSIPYGAWSSGQREFMPLLLSLYWLLPSVAKSSQKNEWVIIEEPEMGLHPRAILSFILPCFELLNRGYKVIISTHSTVPLEVVWALQILKKYRANSGELFRLFNIAKSQPMTDVFDTLLKKEFRCYYFGFKDNQVEATDISSLDPGSSEVEISDWGGLTEFSTRVADIISEVIEVQNGF